MGGLLWSASRSAAGHKLLESLLLATWSENLKEGMSHLGIAGRKNFRGAAARVKIVWFPLCCS